MGTLRPKMLGGFGLLIALVLSAGCQGLQKGEQAWVKPTSDTSHAGNVYLVRGLIGVFSTGMDELAVKLNEAGVRANVFQETQEDQLTDWIANAYLKTPQTEPLVLIGHSYGADDVVRISQHLNERGIKVDLLITIDATTPPLVSGNVAVCYNYYQSQPVTDGIPMFRGIPLKLAPGAQTQLTNVDLRKDRKDLLVNGTNHINIDKNPLLHRLVIEQVQGVCPPRDVWVARQNAPQQARQAADVQSPEQTSRRTDVQARTSN